MNMMFPKNCILVLAGLFAGIGVAAGTFAFFLVIRALPRVAQKAGMEEKVIAVENMVIKGVLFGTIFSLFPWEYEGFWTILGPVFLVLFGSGAGMFTGCIAVALAEILNVFPILLRRMGLKASMAEGILIAMALGKMVGSLFYFLGGYGILGT